MVPGCELVGLDEVSGWGGCWEGERLTTVGRGCEAGGRWIVGGEVCKCERMGKEIRKADEWSFSDGGEWKTYWKCKGWN